MKNILSSFIISITLLTSTASAFYFPDINYGVDNPTPYTKAIYWMYDNKIIHGYGDGTFGPNDCVTRAQILKMIYLTTAEELANPETAIFTDTPANAWYIDYIKTAREKGTIVGYPDGSFRPNQCVRRSEAIQMAIQEFLGETPNINDLNTYAPSHRDLTTEYANLSDLENNKAWYHQQLKYALASNSIGTEHLESNSLAITSFMSRAETAEMLFRFKTKQDHQIDYYTKSYLPETTVKRYNDWLTYKNEEAGYSFQYPKHVGFHPCGTYNAENLEDIPLTIIENDNYTLLIPEKINTWTNGECQTKQADELTTEELREAEHIKFVHSEASNDQEITDFLKEAYQPGCKLKETVESSIPGTYDVSIQGKIDHSIEIPEEESCWINYITYTKYSPEKGKIVKWDIGHDFNLRKNSEDQHGPRVEGYDFEISDSFRFL